MEPRCKYYLTQIQKSILNKENFTIKITVRKINFMKKMRFLTFIVLLSFCLFLQNAFTEFGLPEGAKARFGKGYKTGSSIFSDDGTRFAVASSIGVWVYDVFTTQEVALLTNHPSDFTVMASSPDGSMLASANESTISLWALHTGLRIAQLTEHSESITTLLFSPDGKVLASASEDNTIRLWDATTGKLLFLPLSGHAGDAISLAFSPDSKMLASGSADNSIRLWSATTGAHLATLEEQIAWGVVTHEGHTGAVTAVAFSPDGATLASGGTDNKIRLWDVGTKEHRAAIGGHSEPVTALAFSPDGAMLTSGSTDDTIRLWNPATRRHLDTLQEYETDIITLAFSADGTTLVSGHTDSLVQLWDGRTGEHLNVYGLNFPMYRSSVRAVAFSPHGLTLASGNGRIVSRNYRAVACGPSFGQFSYCRTYTANSDLYSGWGQLWDISTGDYRSMVKEHFPYVYALAFSPNGSTLAIAGKSHFLDPPASRTGTSQLYGLYSPQLWDALTGKHLMDLDGHTDNVSSVAFSADGKILATGSWDDTIRLWNPDTGQHLTTFSGHGDNVNAIAFTPNGETLASGSSDDTIKLWNSEGLVRATLYGHSGSVRTVAFSPDGEILASGSDDNTIRLWNPTTGQPIAALEGHAASVRSVAFSPDGTTLASGSWDGSVRLWDPTTKEYLKTFYGHSYGVNAVAFSSDGTTLASGSGDGTILLWEIEPAVSQNPLDVNGDGIINILDLAAVAASFGKTGQNPADVNGDGVVNVNDIVLVAGAIGDAPAAPSISPQILETLTVADVQQWLIHAEQLKLTDPNMRRGIIVLEQLLEALRQAEAIPTETALLPNYPNPFNPETWIPYQLAEATDVTMTLYAADGRLVRTLALGFQPAGVYRSRTRAAYWDGRNEFGEPVASGIYFYTVTAGDFTATRKMLIRK